MVVPKKRARKVINQSAFDFSFNPIFSTESSQRWDFQIESFKSDRSDQQVHLSCIRPHLIYLLRLSVQDHLCRNILVHFAVNLIKNKKKSLFIEVLNVLGGYSPFWFVFFKTLLPVKSTREVSGNFLFVINLSSSLPSNSELLADEEIFHLIFNKLFGSVKTLKSAIFHQFFYELTNFFSSKLHLRLMIRLLTNTSHRVSVDKMKLIAAKFEPKKKVKRSGRWII